MGLNENSLSPVSAKRDTPDMFDTEAAQVAGHVGWSDAACGSWPKEDIAAMASKTGRP